MANTVFLRGGSHSASVEEVWGEKTWRQAEKDSYFNDGRFVGESSNALIQVNTDLTKDKGDRINTPLRARLISDGKVDDAASEGQEKALTFYNCQTTIHKRKESVRLDGEMTERRTKIRLRTEAKDALGLWLAETRDTDILKGLSGLANSVGTITAAAPTANRRFYGGQLLDGTVGVTVVANDAAITAAGSGHLFGTQVLSHLKRMAQKDGGVNYSKLRPIVIGGKQWFVYFASPWQVKALKQDMAWVAAQQLANVRGESNPLFSGAAGVWDGIIVHEYDKIELRTGDGVGTAPATYFESGDPCGNGITVARGLFCGAQAGILAYGRRIRWVEKIFEYDSQFGCEVSSIYGFNKAKFNSEDFAVISCDTRVVLDS
ncbi:MAG TPA: N4-gp56 family major capsid protein [Anaerohalosphaeraceae bacterium]|jgi:N4-gp56 family major capsid protein|nr:N4-gp56 family major capsid protein [Anaerohalosphaeraceae bacterium]HRT51777.1 N4-gp56 family major capsid protein [Anaerohalosphaeraceae bacterium]HRT87752.1 N4-gp56 family major capsid protein [Anaerohalosphaeraceae bacterium]